MQFLPLLTERALMYVLTQGLMARMNIYIDICSISPLIVIINSIWGWLGPTTIIYLLPPPGEGPGEC